MAVRIIADSLAMTARSSAAVLHALTCRMRSLNLRDMINYAVVLFCFVWIRNFYSMDLRSLNLSLLWGSQQRFPVIDESSDLTNAKRETPSKEISDN
jgi:hypothetical protein